jgi:hypothetical protein
MTANATPPRVQKRYPTLRFLVGLYKVIGLLVLTGAFILGLIQMASNGGFGVLTGIGTIFAGASLSGMCWLIAEGVEVFIGIEENTRQTALSAAQAAAPSPLLADLRQVVAMLASTARLLEQVAEHQQQINQRLDTLVVGLDEVRGGVGTGVRAIEAIAESSKVTATVLYRQGTKHN